MATFSYHDTYILRLHSSSLSDRGSFVDLCDDFGEGVVIGGNKSREDGKIDLERGRERDHDSSEKKLTV